MDDMTPDSRHEEERRRWYDTLSSLLGGILLLAVGVFTGWWGAVYESWGYVLALVAAAVCAVAWLIKWSLYRRNSRAFWPIEVAVSYLVLVAIGLAVGTLSVSFAEALPLDNWLIPATPIGVSL